MELVGAIEAHATLGVAPMTSILHDVAFAVRDALIESLGEARATELRTAGATCPIDDIVLRTRRAARRRVTLTRQREPAAHLPVEVRVQVVEQVHRRRHPCPR